MNRRELIRGGGLSLLSLAITLPTMARPQLWPAGHLGAVSFTYDDGLESHLDLAMPALEQRGMRGSFYVTMQNMGPRLADWVTASIRGHELANHTIHHPCGLPRFTPRKFVSREIAPMEAWLRSLVPADRVPTYAYPCDVTDLGRGSPNRQAQRYARLLARQGIVAARTSEGAPNRPSTALRRPYRLQALAVGYDATDVQTVVDYLASAARKGHWAILVFHDLIAIPNGSGAVSADMHARILDASGSLSLWSAPLGRIYQSIHSQQYL